MTCWFVPFSVAIAVASLGIGLAWVAWFLVGGWQVRDGLAWAKLQIDSGQYGPARDRLARLAAWWPGRAEVEYLLGVCESTLGRTDAALAAWERVPAASPFAASSGPGPGRARRISRRAGSSRPKRPIAPQSAVPGPRAVEARWALAMLLLWQGRLDEVRQLLEEIWRVGQIAIGRPRSVNCGGSIPWSSRPKRSNRCWIRPHGFAPDDDRVWLARAYLASRYGRYSEARTWLDASLRKHPEDPVVWRADLQWAIAAEDPQEAMRALARVPADRIPAPERLFLRAWFAARRNDLEAERTALEHLIAVDPGNTQGLDRLASLALQAGQVDRAAAFRRAPGGDQS